jgi:hypothetical protein
MTETTSTSIYSYISPLVASDSSFTIADRLNPAWWPKLGQVVDKSVVDQVRAHLKSIAINIAEQDIDYFVDEVLFRGVYELIGNNSVTDVERLVGYRYLDIDLGQDITAGFDLNSIPTIVQLRKSYLSKAAEEQKQILVNAFMIGTLFIPWANLIKPVAFFLTAGLSGPKLLGISRGILYSTNAFAQMNPLQQQLIVYAATAYAKYPSLFTPQKAGTAVNVFNSSVSAAISYIAFTDSSKFKIEDLFKQILTQGMMQFGTTKFLKWYQAIAQKKGFWWPFRGGVGAKDIPNENVPAWRIYDGEFLLPTLLGTPDDKLAGNIVRRRDVAGAALARLILGTVSNAIGQIILKSSNNETQIQYNIFNMKFNLVEINIGQALGSGIGSSIRAGISWKAAAAAPKTVGAKLYAYRFGFPAGQLGGTSIGKGINTAIEHFYDLPARQGDDPEIPVFSIFKTAEGRLVYQDGTAVDDVFVPEEGTSEWSKGNSDWGDRLQLGGAYTKPADHMLERFRLNPVHILRL